MFIIPMAGRSSRFYEAGYSKPKYMLPLGESTVLGHSLKSFEKYFRSDKFLILCRANAEEYLFIRREIEALGIKKIQIINLPDVTKGQAETVFLGLKKSSFLENDPLYIFNIDTFRPCFTKPSFEKIIDGYLEVFVGEGDNWSYAKTLEGTDKVIKTAEKLPISDYCCTGLYFFKNPDIFIETFVKTYGKDCIGNEQYIAPMYNSLILDGKDIRINLIPKNDVVFCGVPSEYECLLS